MNKFTCGIGHGLIVLDDMIYDNSLLRDKYIRQLFMNGRHYKTSLLITIPYSIYISPALRTNIDYIFILRENYIANKKNLFEHYGGMFPTFEKFCQTMDVCTDNYECLVIDNTSRSNKLKDIVYWYKAEKVDTIKIGYSNEEIDAVKKIELWFLECKYNPKYKYCKNRILEDYQEMYDEPPPSYKEAMMA